MEFSQIKLRELPTWVKVLKKENLTPEQMLEDLELIDRLLIIQKSKSLMNRKSNFKNQIDKLLSLHLGQTVKSDMQYQKEATKKRKSLKSKK